MAADRPAATARAAGSAPWVRMLRVRRIVPASICAAALLVGCGSPNPKVLDASEEARPAHRSDSDRMSEADKIRKLIDIVRQSKDLHFVQEGNKRDGAAAAAHLERRLARVPAGIPTARQFVDRVAAGKLRASEPDAVVLPDGTTVEAHDWFLEKLAEIEGKPIPHRKSVAAQGPSHKEADEAAKDRTAPRGMGILDVFKIVETSQLRFVSPARRTPSGEVKGKRKEYAATDFAEMLRKKWEFLGADVTDLDTFIEEIASDSFSTFEPYRVVLQDGTEREFRAWLIERLEEEKKKAQAEGQGGAP